MIKIVKETEEIEIEKETGRENKGKRVEAEAGIRIEIEDQLHHLKKDILKKTLQEGNNFFTNLF